MLGWGLAEGEAAWREAVQLVSTATGTLGISLADMTPGDRVQLIGVAVGAWQTIQQRDAHSTAAACAPHNRCSG